MPTAPDRLALLVKQAEHRLAVHLEPLLSERDLTLSDWRILAVLLDRPGLPMTELAELAVLPGASLTRRMDLLVQRALVVRRVHPADKRRVVAALSSRGRQTAERLAEAEREATDAVRAELGGLTSLQAQRGRSAGVIRA